MTRIADRHKKCSRREFLNKDGLIEIRIISRQLANYAHFSQLANYAIDLNLIAKALRTEQIGAHS